MRNIACVLATLVFAACSGVEVRSTAAPNANLGALHTFAFMIPTAPDSPAGQLVSSPVGQQVHDELTSRLLEKGYTPVSEGAPPDFLVAYRGKLQRRTDVQTYGYAGGSARWGGGWGWGWGGWAWDGPQVSVRDYTEGTLIVDFVDPVSHQVLWRGTATGVVEHPDNPNLGKVAKVVDKLIDKYPSSQVAAGNRTHM
jgi:hypothetical protein